MRILLASGLFIPEPLVSARITLDIATELAYRGHDVTVICPWPSRIITNREKAREYDVDLALRNIIVERVESYSCADSNLIGRARESLSFGRSVCSFLKNHRDDYDAVYMSMWPMLGQALLVGFCARINVRTIMHIQDLYPEAWLIRLPWWLRKVLAPPLISWDNSFVKSVSTAIVISEEMRNYYVFSRGVGGENIKVVYNWQDDAPYVNAVGFDRGGGSEYGFSSEVFVFMYLGNIGKTAGVDLLIRAFINNDLPNAELVIVGEGSEKRKCMELVKESGCKSIRFLSEGRAECVPVLQGFADVLLLPLKAGAGLYSVPSKLPSYMLSARPIIACADSKSATARAIVESGCGWIGKPDDVCWLSDRMRQAVSMDKVTLKDVGRRGREYALCHFSKSVSVEKIVSIITESSCVAASGVEIGERDRLV